MSVSNFIRLVCADWRQREYLLIVVAIAISVALVTAITAISGRVDSAMQKNAATLLGGDMVLQTSRDLDAEIKGSISDEQFASATELATMVTVEDDFVLVSLKAVSNSYPLYGEVLIVDSASSADRAAPPIEPGNAWVDPKLLGRLGLDVGDEISLGVKKFVIKNEISSEPDRGADFYSFAPRVLISKADLADTQLVAPGSRVKNRYYFRGTETELTEVKNALSSVISSHEKWVDIQTSRPALGTTIDRAEKYLLSAIVLIWGLAGLALYLCGERFFRQHYEYSAWLRCLGVGSYKMLQYYATKLLLITFAGAIVGCLFGFIIQYYIGVWLDSLLTMDLPAAQWVTFIVGPLAATLLVCGFVLPKMYQLAKIPPNTIIRAGMSLPRSSIVISTISAITSLAVFAVAIIPEKILAVKLAVALPLLFLALLAISRFMLAVFPRKLFSGSVAATSAAITLKRQPWLSALQCVGFVISFAALSTAYLIRTDMIASWQQSIPADAPNHFVINIVPEQAEQYKQYLAGNNVTDADMYPVVRGRLTHIDGNDVSKVKQDSGQRRDESLRRELNLTWSATLPENNEIESGEFWDATTSNEPLVSVEAGVAERLKLNLGDELTFQVGSRNFSATIGSIRTVEWASFQPNFYFIFPPNTIDDLAHTYMTSFYLSPGSDPVLNGMVSQFPSISILPVADIIEQVRNIIVQVGYIVEVLMICVLVTSLLILVSATILTKERRDHFVQMMRTFGAKSSVLTAAVRFEFSLLGVVSGVIAVLLTEASLAILYVTALDMPMKIHWLESILLLVFATLVVGASGYFSSSRITLLRR